VLADARKDSLKMQKTNRQKVLFRIDIVVREVERLLREQTEKIQNDNGIANLEQEIAAKSELIEKTQDRYEASVALAELDKTLETFTERLAKMKSEQKRAIF
jgi:hypothetical protein